MCKRCWLVFAWLKPPSIRYYLKRDFAEKDLKGGASGPLAIVWALPWLTCHGVKKALKARVFPVCLNFIPRWFDTGLCRQHRNRAGCATLLFLGGLRLACDCVTCIKRWRKRLACDCVGSTLVELPWSEKSSESKSFSRMSQFYSPSGLILACVATIATEPVAPVRQWAQTYRGMKVPSKSTFQI
jgi:hypothetical protein